MMKYSGFATVMGGLFLAAAALFLVMTYITKFPALTILAILVAAFFIRWVKRGLDDQAKETLVKTKQKDIKQEREFDAWMKLNGD